VDWREFIASVIDSLAWPAAAAIVAWLLRDQLRQLLAAPIRRLKAEPLEVEWDHEAAEVVESLAALRARPQRTRSPPSAPAAPR
jgi:hypothetical protein